MTASNSEATEKMGPKEKGNTDHKSNHNHNLLWVPKREHRDVNSNTTQTEKTLLYFMHKTLKRAKMPPDKLDEAEILESFKEQINITVSLTMQN